MKRMNNVTITLKPPQFLSTEPASDYDFSGHKVLLVENEVASKELTTLLLSMVNMNVDWTPDGITAVKTFNDAPAKTYSAIILDIILPEIDGYETAKRIRKLSHPEAKTVPIIALTSIDFSNFLHRLSHKEITKYIAKPLYSIELYQSLKKYITN